MLVDQVCVRVSHLPTPGKHFSCVKHHYLPSSRIKMHLLGFGMRIILNSTVVYSAEAVTQILNNH